MDIAQNSISAGATCIEVEVCEDTTQDRLTIQIVDNGRGMSADQVAHVTDPFFHYAYNAQSRPGYPALQNGSGNDGR